MQVPVSVIICTYNRAPWLRRTLLALVGQTIPPDQFEVVVVDDGSNDETAGMCQGMRGVLSNLKVVSHPTNQGLARARNTGIASAAGDYLLFTDDDCIPEPDWVDRASAALELEPIVAGAVTTTTTNYLRLCHNIAEFHASLPDRKPGPAQFIAGANMGLRRSLLQKLEGFSPDDSCAEDMHLILRARLKGYVPYFEPRAVVVHEPDRISFSSILSYASSHAATTILLRNRYGALMRTPFVLRSPFLLLLSSPLIATWTTAGIFLRFPGRWKFLYAAPIVFLLKMAWCWGAGRGLLGNSAEERGTCPET